MLKWLALQFVLVAVCCICTNVLVVEAATGGLESFGGGKESQRQRQQGSPSSSSSSTSSWSPFSQWRWLNSVLSLHENQVDGDSARKANPPSEKNAEEDSTLSLVLLLDESDEEDRTTNEMSKVHASLAAAAPSPPLASFHKRSRSCMDKEKGRCRRGGQVSMIPAAQVQQGWENDYSSVPEVLIQFSQQQAEETACDDLSVQLFQVDLKEHYLEPVWVREIVHLGMCPSKLQTRHFGEHVWPSSIVETKCLCHHKTCSNLGGDFRCQSVRRPIRTWVRHMEKFLPAQEMITVGCVCVQRSSPEGRYAKPAVES